MERQELLGRVTKKMDHPAIGLIDAGIHLIVQADWSCRSHCNCSLDRIRLRVDPDGKGVSQSMS